MTYRGRGSNSGIAGTSAGFDVIVWAMDHAPVIRRKDGKIDQAAHAVLNALAVWADGRGIARPSLPQIANRAYLDSLRATSEALGRLGDAGLIVAVADLNGTTVWQLQTHLVRDSAELVAVAARRVTAQQKTNERQRRKRDRRRRHEAGDHGSCLPKTCAIAAERHAVVERDAEVDDESLSRRSRAVRHAVVERDAEVDDESLSRRSRAVRHAVVERDVTPCEALHPQVTPAVTTSELPINCHEDGLGDATHHPRATETENASTSGGIENEPVPVVKLAATGTPAKTARPGRGRQLPLIAPVPTPPEPAPEPDLEDQDMRAHLRELLERPTHRPPDPAALGPTCPRCEVLLDPDQQCRNTTCQPASPTAPPTTGADECVTCGVLLDPDRVCRNPTHRSTG